MGWTNHVVDKKLLVLMGKPLEDLEEGDRILKWILRKRMRT
jgi:hypothetical protein